MCFLQYCMHDLMHFYILSEHKCKVCSFTFLVKECLKSVMTF